MRVLDRSVVLGYHTLSPLWVNSVAVRPDLFRAQMELLLQEGYHAVTFSSVVAHPEQRAVAVTFDDGFQSVHELALPILDELGMIATLFTPTAFTGSGTEFVWEGYDRAHRGSAREMTAMSWEQVRDLAAHGWEIGSHTRTHPHLPRLDDDLLLEELRASREECTAGAGVPCRTIAYPYGEVDQRVRNAAGAAGYQAAAALGPQWKRRDPLWWPRIGVYRGDDLRRFRLKLRRPLRSRAFALGVGAARRLGSGRA